MKAGWEVKALGDVANVGAGNPAPKKHELDEASKIPFVRTSDVGQIKLGEIYDSRDHIPASVNARMKIFPIGTILFPKSGASTYLNHRVSLAMASAVAGHLAAIKAKPEFILDRYLFYFLSTIDAKELNQDNSYPSLNLSVIKSVPISYPPLEEQKRIVAILDTAFEGLDRARAHLEANLQNANDLFEKYTLDLFEKEVSQSEMEKLEALTSKITKGSSPKWQGVSYVQEPGVLFITSENVGSNTMLMNKTKYVEETFNERDKKSILNNGDVLTNIVGASIGRTAIYDKDEVANINQAVCLIRCNSEKLLNSFLAYLLNSPYFKAILHSGEVNMARANLSLTFFRELKIPIPDIRRQKEIVAQVNRMRTTSLSLEMHYQSKLADLDDLRQSLLQKAFAGELT